MKYIRKILGVIIVFFDAITRPKPMHRSENEQIDADNRAKSLSLYQFHGCPFCVKVRRTLHRLNINIKLHDAMIDTVGSELLKEGGKRKVPCLRIDKSDKVQWMYNSKDIIAYLQSSFA